MLERLLKACGPLISWKRSTANPDRPQSFGLAEFDCIESVFAAVKTMNNLKLYQNTILVKADQKTQSYFEDWVAEKKTKWLARQEKLGNPVDLDLYESMQKQGRILPWEKQLIPQFEEIILEFKEALEDHVAGVLPSAFLADTSFKLSDQLKQDGGGLGRDDSLLGSEQARAEKAQFAATHIIDSENVFIEDTLANKYKDNERE